MFCVSLQRRREKQKTDSKFSNADTYVNLTLKALWPSECLITFSPAWHPIQVKSNIPLITFSSSLHVVLPRKYSPAGQYAQTLVLGVSQQTWWTTLHFGSSSIEQKHTGGPSCGLNVNCSDFRYRSATVILDYQTFLCIANVHSKSSF